MSSLTYDKYILQNRQLNIIGKKLLKDKLFAYNNDLRNDNTKDYATAFEAVVGFISLLNINKAFKLLDSFIM
jgi:23S rRNA maturation mini-RNase III